MPRFLLRFLSVRWAVIVLAIAFGVFVGTGFFTFIYANGTSYLSNNPQACVNCHVMQDQYDGWAHGSHHNVATCNDCHVPHDFVGKWYTKAENGYAHSVAMTFGNFHEPIAMRPVSERVLLNNCIACHEPIVDQMVVGHGDAVDVSNCLQCHSEVGHGGRK